MLSTILWVVFWALVYLVAAVGACWALFWERRRPSSYTRRPGPRRSDDLAWWGLLPAEEQEAVDTAALDLGAQAEIDAAQGAAEAAEFLAHRAQVNALFRP